ncbi:hypothetical protein O3P69_007147 [Scylla paramamosain]|uniref:Uncharacterized protein n=1 Tax=Scylla paramamosain TaxID=85552 RepID=A0AAW0V2Z0_SCYPA
MGLKERREVSVISTLLDNDSPKLTCVDFTITGLFTRKTAPMRLTRVVVLSSFPDGLTKTKADSELLAKWTHLKDLAYINRRAECLPVEILNGQDVPAALTSLEDEVRQGEKWDRRLTKENEDKWAIWLRELEGLAEFLIDRCIFSSRFGRLVTAQLHHFCDASTKAYAAVSYMKMQDDTDFVQSSFIMACTRLALLKSTTVPRQELSLRRHPQNLFTPTVATYKI